MEGWSRMGGGGGLRLLLVLVSTGSGSVCVVLSVGDRRDRQELGCRVSHVGVDHWCCGAR